MEGVAAGMMQTRNLIRSALRAHMEAGWKGLRHNIAFVVHGQEQVEFLRKMIREESGENEHKSLVVIYSGNIENLRGIHFQTVYCLRMDLNDEVVHEARSRIQGSDGDVTTREMRFVW